MHSDQFYIIGDPLDHLKNSSPDGFLGGKILTMVVQHEDVESIRYKIGRIEKQTQFSYKHQEQFNALTSREMEILVLIAKGSNNPQIAEKLFISRSTVEQHRKNINKKLQVKSMVDIMRYALAFNLI